MENNLANPGFWTYFIGSYAYYLPFVLTTVWAPIALYDLSKNVNLSQGKLVLWSALILLIPVFGGAIYLLSQKTEFNNRFKYTAVGGGLIVLFVIWGLSLVLHI